MIVPRRFAGRLTAPQTLHEPTSLTRSQISGRQTMSSEPLSFHLAQPSVWACLVSGSFSDSLHVKRDMHAFGHPP